MSHNRLGLLEFPEHCSNLSKAQSEVCWLNFFLRIEFNDVPVCFKYGCLKFFILCSEMFPINLIVPNKQSIENYVFKMYSKSSYHTMLSFGNVFKNDMCIKMLWL